MNASENNSAVVTLKGCAPIPLAHYLKALGVLRLVSEQANSSASGKWERDAFVLISSLDSDALLDFFLSKYHPTPVLAPWNGGSGFYKKDNREALEAIMAGKTVRLGDYQTAILAAQKAIASLGLTEKPDAEAKDDLLNLIRNTLPESVLAWLDAAYVLGLTGAKYPPLLGTGGNDGRLEFTNNFMQRITEIIDPANGEPTAASARWLRQALFAEAAPGSVAKKPIGQFFPGAAGGANATSGFDADSAVNPWDFVLMIEGALLFAAASVKKLESGDFGQLIYPFCVRQAGVGYGSASLSDEANSRCEMWMPLWDRATKLGELKAVLGEGRAQVGGRPARNGVDFTRAAVTLGVDRGLTAFQRFGFQVRNGLAYFATPLERVAVRRNARADLLADIDGWLDRLRSKAGPQANPAAPASVTRALNQLEARILDLCRNNDRAHVQAVLVALGRCERALARSFRWTTSDTVRLRPLAGLTPRWLSEADTGSPEFRLAAALASTRGSFGTQRIFFRQHLEHVEAGEKDDQSWAKWLTNPGNDVVWHDGDLTNSLNAIFSRRVLHAVQSGCDGFPDFSKLPARLDDIADFIVHRIDDDLLADLVWGLCAINWAAVESKALDATQDDIRLAPSSLYAMLRLCFRRPRKGDDAVPVIAAIHQRAAQGDGAGASVLAARRLLGSGFAPAVSSIPVKDQLAKRTAAALIFPIDPRDFFQLENTVLRPKQTANL